MREGNSVLVTGGAGFLGSHLCERLLRERRDVVCIDSFYTGTRRNVEHLLGYRNFELLRHDVTFPLYVETDQIYNLACPASPIHYQHDPVQTTKTRPGGDAAAGEFTPADFTGPVNVGNPVEFTMMALAEQVLKLVGSASKVVFKPLPEDDPKQRKPDITLARRALGWEPKVGIEDGLKETIAYFRELLAA